MIRNIKYHGEATDIALIISGGVRSMDYAHYLQLLWAQESLIGGAYPYLEAAMKSPEHLDLLINHQKNELMALRAYAYLQEKP